LILVANELTNQVFRIFSRTKFWWNWRTKLKNEIKKVS